jgi:flagellar hook-basal body complex protein FliE
VVKRVEDVDAYKKAEPALLEKLIEVRNRLVAADLGWALQGLG